ncbi:TonB-dependent receptor [Chryseobacterium sp. 1B4]
MQAGGSISEQAILSYGGRLNYNYQGKYFLQASLRRDGLSALPLKNKWGNFPGISAGWTLSKENFMHAFRDVIPDLKLRVSYAKVGNTNIGNYPYMGLYSNSKYADYNGITFSQIGNDELIWETSAKTDYGADMALFKNKLKITFDYFENKISDMILDAPLASSLGVPGNSISRNIGDMNNTGLEFSVDYELFNAKNFGLEINANLTLMKNKVLALANNNADMLSTNTIIRVGESLRSIYGFEYWG